jgi:hypothetical protein
MKCAGRIRQPHGVLPLAGQWAVALTLPLTARQILPSRPAGRPACHVAIPVKVYPGGGINMLPKLSVSLLDSAGQLGRMVSKMIIDTPQQTDAWRKSLSR